MATSRRNCVFVGHKEFKKETQDFASNGSFVSRLTICPDKSAYICIHIPLSTDHAFNKSLLSTYSVPSTA